MHKTKVEFLQPVFFFSLFPHLLTWVPGLSICWMSSEKPGNRKPLQMHLALWKMCSSWLESKHLVFSLTSWIHAFCSLHYTCTFLWEINALHVKAQIHCIVHSPWNVRLVSEVPLVSSVLTHVYVSEGSWAKKEGFCMFSLHKDLTKCEVSSSSTQGLDSGWRSGFSGIVKLISWLTVGSSQGLLMQDLFKIHNSSCACVILLLFYVID